MSIRILSIALSLLALLPGISLGQVYNDLNNREQNRHLGNDPYSSMRNLGGNPFESVDDEENQQDKPDTTKKKRPRKPLESYFFNDSIRMMPNFVWSVDKEVNNIYFKRIDTMLNDAQLDYPFQREDVGDAHQGNLGAASVPLNFFRRPTGNQFTLAQPYYSYMFNTDGVRFYNVKQPFTQLSYYTQGQKQYAEDNFTAIHAQNISPSTGFNIEYKSRGTRGYYTWQGTRDKSLSLALNHTGKKYTAHAGYVYNGFDIKENGGIVNDRDVTDTIYEIPANIPVSLNDARVRIRSNTFYLVESYAFPLRKLADSIYTIADKSTITFGHSFEFSRFSRRYKDTKAQSGDYYENWYFDQSSTYDSIFETSLSNKVFMQLQPWDRDAILGVIDAGMGVDNASYYQNFPSYKTERQQKESQTYYYAYGAMKGKYKKYLSWGADLKYHPFGERSQDMEIGGNVIISAYMKKNRPITLKGEFRYAKTTPSFWSDYYYSNHFKWDNSFKQESDSRIEVSLNIPSVGLEVKASQGVLSDKIYYDQECLPKQHDGIVSVTSLYLREDVKIGGLHLNHRVLLQGSNNQDVIPVPAFSAYITYLYQFNVVKDVLKVQLGIDGRYNTKYWAFGFNPAVGQIYNQQERKLGGYPMMDAFVSAKWKRMRILLKMSHINEDMFGSRDYFTMLHYPLNKRAFKIGISWGFYD